MKKGMLWMLAAILLLLPFSGTFAEETRPAELLELWDYGAESPVWIASAVPVTDGLVMTSTAVLPQDTEHLVVSDGVTLWEVQAVLPDSSGLVALVFYNAEKVPPRYDSWPFLPWGESAAAADCFVRTADERGSRINRGILDAEEHTWQGFRCFLLTLSGPVQPGSPVLTENGQLAGLVVAEWAEGVSRYLALSPEEIAGVLTSTAALLDGLPDWGEPPQGLNVTLEKNLATIEWKDMVLPEKAEGETLYLVLVDTGNDYLNYVSAETETCSVSFLLTPGRFYMAGIVAAADIPESIPEDYVTFTVPQAKRLTEYGFRPLVTVIAEMPEGGLKNGEAPVPVTEVTEELLRSGRAYFYSSSRYEVTETVDGKSLLVTLTTPDGVNYRHESGWIYGPEYMAEDIWYLSLDDTGLIMSLNQNGYPRGIYRMAYYVDGDLADSFEFELK